MTRNDALHCPHTGAELERLAHPALSDFGRSPTTGALHYARAHELEYGDDYFLTEYKNQYGKTYIEDEANLRRLARRRLGLLPEPSGAGRTLLEIGCACGFFLDEAREAGYAVRGLEISPYGATFAREELGLDVIQRSFLSDPGPDQGPSFDLAPGGHDVVAAFFVLEHFADQQAAWRRVASLVKPGGLLLIALPSLRGPLFECSPDRWARTHPADHFADYCPLSLRAMLPLYDLRPVRMRPMSYHPDRACGPRGARLMRPLYRTLADLQCFGDTMEALAIKKR